MSAPIDSDFEKWLSKKLTSISADIDLEVFVTYITGILETEDTAEERIESISGLLSEIVEEGTESHCDEISQKWDEFYGSKAKAEQSKVVETFEDKVHKMVEKQQSQTVKTHTVDAETKARKQAILAQYAQVSDGEDSDDEKGDAAGAAEDLARNINSLSVTEKEQEMRERMKQDSENKKTKDREDREKQKQKAVDRKESEKKRTQKGEKRR